LISYFTIAPRKLEFACEFGIFFCRRTVDGCARASRFRAATSRIAAILARPSAANRAASDYAGDKCAHQRADTTWAQTQATTNTSSAGGRPFRASPTSGTLPNPNPASGGFSASPISGPSPLAVKFDDYGAGGDSISFGDGSSGTMAILTDCNRLADGTCDASSSAWHTYTTAGSYVATLWTNCHRTLRTCEDAQLGTVTITVGQASASPVSGMSQSNSQNRPIHYPDAAVEIYRNAMTVTPTSGTTPLKVTFSNFAPGCANETDIYFGDTPNAMASNGFNGSWPTGGVVHTYTSPGTYTAELYCISAPTTLEDQVTITVH
jgi:hypothetical protein